MQPARADQPSCPLPTPVINPEPTNHLCLQGAVPVIAYQKEDTVHNIYESLICNEFLEDFQPTPAMLPPHPAVKARARLIIDRLLGNICMHGYNMCTQAPANDVQRLLVEHELPMHSPVAVMACR